MSFYTNRSRARAIDVGNIVAPVAGRLESLTLHSPITSRALRQLSDPPLRFPRLHTLYLDSKSRLDIIHTPYPSFPALSKLTLSHNKFVPHQEQFLWQNLVSLDMKSRVNAKETVDVLRTCSSLKNCRLSIDEIQGTTAHFFRGLQRKSLPCLTSFHLRFYNETDYTCFLLPFTFPRLEDLSINFCHKFVCGWPQELKEYLSQRPWPQLQSFFVPYPSRSYIDNRIAPTTPLELEPEGIEFLSKLPTLFAVNFPDQTIISDKTLLDIGTGKLLPKLERFSIYAGEIDQILTMLETRNNPQQTGHNGCSKFKAVYLRACNLSISANAHKRIAALRKENLVVTIQHQDARKDTKWEKVVCPEGIPWVNK
ncbi:hypothetical protein AMATHDRAFT_48757 [Amanita thiersii Skay4041]|uniref:F-box domain-containing protein n=1 Tax=Amanita thiersii Skay4041 TaxID=703135 RepID=A0A2A9NM22_9AGAR|nr:hypothetical protein AMATHDRAFT_48757 [Amanita thiersii Skay4041]